MKVKILAGLVTALFYGGSAMAQDVSDTQSKDTQGQQSPDNFGGSGLDDNNPDDLIILDQQDVAPVPDQGVGGSGDQGISNDQGLSEDVNKDVNKDQDAFGGSGQAGQPAPSAQQAKPGIPMQGQGGVTLYCTPVNQQSTGGSGLIPSEQPAVPSTQPAVPSTQPAIPSDQQSSLQPGYDVGQVPVDSGSKDEAFGGSGYEVKSEEHHGADLRGVSVLVGGGLEGYTGGLASEIDPGAAANVMAVLKPTSVLGFELGYSGAVNDLDVEVPGSGPDIVRNGAVANLTIGLTATPIQPYVLGGFGMNWYNVRNGEAIGFRDDTNSKIPVGVGLRTQIGHFTADARANYNFLLSDDFAPVRVDTGNAATGSYSGTINLGGTF